MKPIKLTDAQIDRALGLPSYGRAWDRLMHWSESFDERDDLSDEARAWADTESHVVATPENTGEWKASLETAFEAGRQYERLLKDEKPELTHVEKTLLGALK